MEIHLTITIDLGRVRTLKELNELRRKIKELERVLLELRALCDE